MKRSDSVLYSGVTSASSDPRTPREIQKEAKDKIRLKLKPAAEIVLEAIELEKSKATNLESLIVTGQVDLSPEDLKVEICARKLYRDYLNSLNNVIVNTLSEKKK